MWQIGYLLCDAQGNEQCNPHACVTVLLLQRVSFQEPDFHDILKQPDRLKWVHIQLVDWNE